MCLSLFISIVIHLLEDCLVRSQIKAIAEQSLLLIFNCRSVPVETISSVTILLVFYDWELIPVSRFTETVLLQSINKIVLSCVVILLCCCYWY